jgi:hypothetical protein
MNEKYFFKKDEVIQKFEKIGLFLVVELKKKKLR